MILQKPSDLDYTPHKIVSLVPSQTELLHYLGLEAETIGITKFCVHPATWFKTKERVGGTKTVNIKKVRQLQPDLIIANKEENVKEQIEELAIECPVWVTDVTNLKEALLMITNISTLTGKNKAASSLISTIKDAFNQLPEISHPLQTAYLIWREPYITVGGDTFIHDMLLHCGLKNVFSEKARYPEITIANLRSAKCDLLLLSSEPYPFKQKHIDEISAVLPGTRIMLVDGEFFSWYGSRLLKAAAYFKQIIAKIHT